MGAFTSKPNLFYTLISPNQWQQSTKNVCSIRPSHGSYISYQHKISNQQIDKYQLQFASQKDQQVYYQCCLRRFRQSYLVNVCQYVEIGQKQFCSHKYAAEVFIEHIPVRLGDVTDIPYPDTLYVLRNSLFGFGSLFNMCGAFRVEEDHVCINGYGEVKVWLNTDLSKNYPQDILETLSQRQMVTAIIDLIENNTNAQECPLMFSKYIAKKNKKYVSFSEASNLLAQYIKDFKVQMPKYCESIFEIFNEDNNAHKLSSDSQNESSFLQNQSFHGHSKFGSSVESKSLSSEKMVPRISIRVDSERQVSNRETVKNYSPSNHPNILNEQNLTRLKAQKTQRVYYVNKDIVNGHVQKHPDVIHKLSEKKTPIKIAHSNKPYSDIKIENNIKINFTYWLPERFINNQKTNQLSYQQDCHDNHEKDKISFNKFQHEQNSETMQKIKLREFYTYDTGIGSEEIDPEIAADLLKYL